MNKSKSNKSRTGRRRASGRRGQVTDVGVVSRLPLPLRHTARLNYAEVVTLSLAASTLGTFYYYQTSLYDPRGSVGGHQPLYFDQLSAIYSRYRVDGLSYAITVSSNTGNGGFCLVRAQPASTIETNVESLCERPQSNSTVVTVYGGPITLTGSFKTHEVLGVTKQKYLDDPNYSAAVGSNPALMAYLIPYFYTYSEATTFNIKMEMTFHCTFFEQQIVSGS